MQVAFAVADVHVEDVVDRDLHEGGLELAGEGARDEALAAPGRPVQQEAATQVLPVEPSQLWIAKRRKECHLEALLDVGETADVGKHDRLAPNLPGRNGGRLIRPLDEHRQDIAVESPRGSPSRPRSRFLAVLAARARLGFPAARDELQRARRGRIELQHVTQMLNCLVPPAVREQQLGEVKSQSHVARRRSDRRRRLSITPRRPLIQPIGTSWASLNGCGLRLRPAAGQLVELRPHELADPDAAAAAADGGRERRVFVPVRYATPGPRRARDRLPLPARARPAEPHERDAAEVGDGESRAVGPPAHPGHRRERIRDRFRCGRPVGRDGEDDARHAVRDGLSRPATSRRPGVRDRGELRLDARAGRDEDAVVALEGDRAAVGRPGRAADHVSRPERAATQRSVFCEPCVVRYAELRGVRPPGRREGLRSGRRSDAWRCRRASLTRRTPPDA